MIQFDRFTKIMLVIIALLLSALVIRGRSVGVESQAIAQQPATDGRLRVDVKKLTDIPVKNFKEVILLGDGKTFLIRVDDGVGVYQVQETWTSP